MATLSNTKIKDTYQSLVKFNDNGNITTSPKRLTDGFGNASPFYVSTTQIGIGTSPNSSYDLHVYANAKIGANLDVSGNLTVNGTLTYLNVTDLAVEDPLIKLAKDNDANILDIGLFGKYAVSTNVKYKGFFNDASDDKFKIFTGLTTEPTTTVDVSDSGYTVGTLVANVEGTLTGVIASSTTATTQNADDNSTKVATTAYVDTAAGNYLPLSGGTMTGDIAMGTNDVSGGGTATFTTFTGNLTGNVTGNVTGNLTGNVTGNITGNVTGGTISGTTGAFSSTLSANGGINGLTFANGGISGSNYDITGVNQLIINDPGEGIVFTGTTTLYLSVIDDTVDDKLKLTNATQLDLNSTAKITNLVDPTNNQDAATKKYVDDNIGSAEVAKRIDVTVKNVSGGSLSKGVVVHAAPTATPPSGNVIEVIAADANDAAKMPAIGVLNETIADEAEGEAVMFGAVSGIDTSSFSIGDELYVSETAGEFTATKPTAFSSQVQKIAVVIKSHASNGLIKVFGAGRANDVPNRVDRDMNFTDNSELSFGDSSDLKIYHTTNNIVRINTGDLIFNSFVVDGDIKFQLDNGSGSVTEYMRLDGGEQRIIYGRSPQIVDNLKLYFGNDTVNDASIRWDSTASQLFIDGESKFLNDAYVVGNLGIGTAVADSPIHVSKGGLNTTGQDYGVHIGVLESGANRYAAIELVSNGALSGWIDFSNTDSANDYNERIRGGDGTLRFFSDGEEAVYINNTQHTNFNEDIIVTSNDHNISTIEANENSTHFGRLHYMHSDFTTSGTNIADSLLLVASNQSTGGIVIRADKPSSEIVFAIGDSSIENIVMKITDGANGVEFFPTSTAEGGHIALRADTDGSYRYAIDNYNDTVRIVRQADADATGGLVVASVDENGDFSVTRDFVAGRTGYFTSNSGDNRVLYLDQNATDAGNIIQFRDQSDTYTWEVVGRNNQFYIYNNGLSRHSLYINPTNNFIGINGNVAPKAFLHVTDGTNSYPTDSNNKLVVESTGHTYIGLGGGDASDVGIHFGDSTNVARGRLAYIHSEDAMKISTNGAVRYTLDGYGNVAYNSTIKQSNGTWRNFGFGSLKMFGRANDSNTDGGIGTNFYFTTANAELRASAHAASRIWFNDDQINFDNAGTGLIDSAITWNNRMVINSSGNIGIGTDTPEEKLVVMGDIGFGAGGYNGGVYANNTGSATGVDSNWGLEVQRTANVDDYNTRLKYYPTNGTSRKAGIWNSRDNYFTIYSAADAVPNVIIPNGRLGIGSTNPGRGLTIDKSNEFASLEIIKNNSGNQIVYLGTGSSGTGENSILQLKDGTVEKIRMYSTGTSWITGGNLVIGNTTSTYDFEVYGTDAKMFAHYTSNSRGGIAAFSSQRIAMTTTSINDNLVFGYNSAESSTSANFVERMRIDNGTGYVGIANSSPGAFLNIGTYNVAGKYIDQTTYPTTPSQHLLHLTAPSTTNRYGGGISWGETTFSAANIVAIDAGGGGALHLAFGTGDSPNGVTERLRIDYGGTVIAKAELRANTSVRVFGNNVSDIAATNSPTTTSANISTYLNEYSFIDLSSSNANGSWIDFSNANGTDYGGRIRYNFNVNRMSFSAGTGERFQVNVGTTTALNTLEAAQATYSAFIGSASFSWGGSTQYPTIYGSASDRWVMFTFPHIACLQNGVNGHTGTSTGAKIRFASNPSASSFWDAGVDLQYNAADRFSIARGGAIMINCLPPNSTYSGLASRDWTIFGTGSRAGAIAINDVAGANYAIHGGGNDLTFSKSVNGTSLANALAILGSSNADSSPDVKVYNDLTVDGTATVGNAATITSNSNSRVLYLKQHTSTGGNIIQFQSNTAVNAWEVVGRTSTFYIYNNMNGQGFALYINPANNYIGIDKSSASYNLDVAGTIRATSDVIAFSDKRVKENIVTIDNALDKVTKLRGVTYTRKDTDDKSTKVGVIAQEVLEVLPEVVEKDDEGMYSVAYGNMAGVFIEAIKELKAEVDSLKQEIKELKK